MDRVREIAQVLPNGFYNLIKGLIPMIILFSVVMASVRIAAAIEKKEKIVLYKDIKALGYIVFCFVLFQLVTTTDYSSVSNNFIPFKEILRYKDLTSGLFMRNVIGNIIIFIPFGFLISDLLNDKTEKDNILVSGLIVLITSLSIELIQMYIGRSFDIDDIILNLTGGIIGYLVYVFIHWLYTKLPKIFENDWVKLLIVILFNVVVIFSIYFLFEVMG